MAKINVVGDAVVVTSALKLEDIKTLEKYRPDALVLKDEEGEPVFKLATSCCGGSIGKYGATFSSTTHDDEKLATFTSVLKSGDSSPEEIKEFIADVYGYPVMTLNKLEATLTDVLTEVELEKEAVLDSIEIA